jgi:hypothetical protein
MPTILRKNGFRFFIPTLDHAPPHVHVEKAGHDAKFLLLPVVELVETRGMKMKDLTEAFEIAQENHEAFLAAWRTIHPET